MPDEPLELNPNKTVIYRVVAALLIVLSKVLFRPTVTGAQNIPEAGPVLIAPIHRSNLDFAFTLFMSRRKVFFMAKDSIFKVPVLGTLVHHLGAFSVNRGAADREAMALSEQVLRAGQALVLFPEGTRKEGLAVAPIHDGAMFVAARTGATVVPVGIGGSERAMPKGAKFLKPVRITVSVGQALPVPTREPGGRVARSQIHQLTETLRERLQEAYDDATR